MMLHKEVKTLGMPWEAQYGYAQAVRVDDTIYVSGQLSRDDRGNMSALLRWMIRATYEITRTEIQMR